LIGWGDVHIILFYKKKKEPSTGQWKKLIKLLGQEMFAKLKATCPSKGEKGTGGYTLTFPWCNLKDLGHKEGK